MVDVVITHENGDFDALASLAAAAKLYPGSVIIMPEPLQPNVRSFINLYRDLLPLSEPGELDKGINSVVVVDTNQKNCLGKWSSILDRAKQVTVYDHHPGKTDMNADCQVIEALGATTTILLEEIRERKIKLTEFEATLFILGIYEDTGCLTYEITTARDARAVAYLWGCSPSTRLIQEYLPPALTADKVASKPVFTVKSDITVAEADDLLAEHSFKGCPVVEDNRLVGIISRRDLRKGLRSELAHAPVKGFMTRELITAAPDQSLIDLRRLMVEENIGRVPIVDKDGSLVGIVTRSDILRYLSSFDRRGRSLKIKKDGGNDPGRRDLAEESEENELLNLSSLLNNELPGEMQRLLIKISRLAEREEIKIYLVGGIIRDLLLQYPPEKDLDFVVIGDAVEFAFALQKLLGGNVRHFEQFGTASLDLPDGLRLDLVTARKEFYISPAALPRVEKSSLKNDLFRRDFTINTMACSLEAEHYGEFYDYYNGKKDLENRLIRALYQLSFVDDPLRILRAVRFEQRYNFVIETKTLDLIHKAIEKKVLEKVSRQRLHQELKLIYKEPSPVKILKRFSELNVLPVLYPQTKADNHTWKLLFRLEEILSWVGSREWEENPDSELTFLSGLLYRLESADRSAIIRKSNLSRERASIVLKACREAPAVLKKLDQSDLNPSDVVNHLEPLSVEAILLAYALTEKKNIREHLKLYMDGLRYIRPRLRGGDLKELGIKPGPLYRKIIDSLKQAVLDGEVCTPQEELDYVITYLEAEKGKDE